MALLTGAAVGCQQSPQREEMEPSQGHPEPSSQERVTGAELTTFQRRELNVSPLWRGARSNHEFGKNSKLMVPLSRWAGRTWVRPVCNKSGVQMQRRPQRAPRSISVALSSSCASPFLTQLPQDTSGHQTYVGISTHPAILQGSSWRSCDVTPF